MTKLKNRMKYISLIIYKVDLNKTRNKEFKNIVNEINSASEI